MDSETNIAALENELADKKEQLFLAQLDLKKAQNQNIELRNFLQNLYESCHLDEDHELQLTQVIDNLKENIRVFARANNIRL